MKLKILGKRAAPIRHRTPHGAQGPRTSLFYVLNLGLHINEGVPEDAQLTEKSARKDAGNHPMGRVGGESCICVAVA